MSSRTNAQGHGPPDLCLHIITYGASNGDPNITLPILLHFDVSTMRPPHRELLRHLTGLSPQVAQAFFALPGHEDIYRSMASRLGNRLQSLLRQLPPGRGQPACFAVLVNCTFGRHRSVAVAERLARNLFPGRRSDRIIVDVEHLDLDLDYERELRRAQGRRSGSRNLGGFASWMLGMRRR